MEVDEWQREIKGTSQEEMVEAEVQDAAANLVVQALRITRHARENVPPGKAEDQSTCDSRNLLGVLSSIQIKVYTELGPKKELSNPCTLRINSAFAQKKSSMSLQILLQKCAGKSSLSAT